MSSYFQQLVDQMISWLQALFFKQEMELTLVGLQNSGKTTLVNVIATGGFSEDMIPTVGFNMRKVTKGKVTIKLWDLGGQPRFRSMWERYCRGVHAIVYVVDSADAVDKLSRARATAKHKERASWFARASRVAATLRNEQHFIARRAGTDVDRAKLHGRRPHDGLAQ